MNRTLHPIEGAASLGLVLITGKFAVGTTGAVGAITDDGGFISGIVRNSAGDYTISLDDRVQAIKDFIANVRATTAVDLKCQPTTFVASSTATSVKFRVLAVATPTDPSSGDDVHFSILVQQRKHGVRT